MTTPRPRVLCAVDLSSAPEALEIVREAAEVEYIWPITREEFLRRLPEYDAVWSHLEMKLDRETLALAPRLRAINTATTGTDHIDKAYAAERGIRVLCIARDYGLLDTFTATAECAWMLMLVCHRHFRRATQNALQGAWGVEGLVGEQLSGRTLGVLGVGRLGKMTAEYGRAFRMRVFGCDVRPFSIAGVERVDFDTLLRAADAISIHIHMTPENRHLFNAETFGRMKPGAVLVNTSRGDIVDEAALLDALESGRLAAYGTDVLHDEWRADMRDQPLIRYAQTHDNVVITPHIGGATARSIRDARLFSARKLAHFLWTGEELTQPSNAQCPCR